MRISKILVKLIPFIYFGIVRLCVSVCLCWKRVDTVNFRFRQRTFYAFYINKNNSVSHFTRTIRIRWCYGLFVMAAWFFIYRHSQLAHTHTHETHIHLFTSLSHVSKTWQGDPIHFVPTLCSLSHSQSTFSIVLAFRWIDVCAVCHNLSYSENVLRNFAKHEK